MKIEYEVLKKLEEVEKPYFTVAELSKILERKREDLYVIIHRLVKGGALKTIRPGVYRLTSKPVDLSLIANQTYFPSYLSFESALANYGILNQIPHTLSFATTRKSKTVVLEDHQEVRYRHLNKNLFFGYKRSGKLEIAEPEKALIDQLYLVSLGKASLDFDEINLWPVKQIRLKKYGKFYPKKTRRLLNKLLNEVGKWGREGVK